MFPLLMPEKDGVLVDYAYVKKRSGACKSAGEPRGLTLPCLFAYLGLDAAVSDFLVGSWQLSVGASRGAETF